MSAPEKPLVSEEEMANARLSLGARDLCAHLLIPLNRCRTETMFAPWKCSDERHSYEKCEYELFLRRMKKMEAFREATQ
ncbi:unnamed protein product [Closterium sp. NIES-53]